MAAFLLRRMARSVVSLVGLVFLVFFLVRLTGNPADLYLPEGSPPEVYEEFVKAHGLDAPLAVQFGRFVSELATLNLGSSMRQGRPALEIVLEAFPVTLHIAGVTLTIVSVLSILIGSWAAFRPDSLFDKTSGGLALLGASAPNFWIALTLITVFAVGLRWLPTSGTGTLAHWIMPVTVLVLAPLGMLVQVVRSAMITALQSRYIRTARGKGLPASSILFVHALRNASLPTLTTLGNQAVNLINGTIIVESIFGWPGIGKLLIDAILQRDFAIVQAATVVIAAAIFVINIVVDMLYVVLDPRTGEA